MKIALAQCNPTIGDFDGSIKTVERVTEAARSAGADLVVLSELFATGYPPRDLLEYPSFIDQNERLIEHVATLSEKLAIIVGGVARNGGQTGHRLHNAAFVCRDGRVTEVVYKSLLPNYDVFDERRYFEPADTIKPITIDGVQIGITICEDLWNEDNMAEAPYTHKPVDELVLNGAELIINLSASPFWVGKNTFRQQLFAQIARRTNCPVIFVNQVGANDDLIFDGNSFAVDAGGNIVVQARAFQEDVVFYDAAAKSDIVTMETAPAEPVGFVCTSYQWDRDQVGEAYEALVLGVSDYFRKCGIRRAVLGLSGGVDSALVAVLAVAALGADNVTGVLMSSPYTSQQSIDDAMALGNNLRIRTPQIDIGPIMKIYDKSFHDLFEESPGDLTNENIQARIRGALLMAYSNQHGDLVLSTGNKSELAVGYCTLYGDMSGGLAVISDVPKTQVYSLCRYINRNGEVIPTSILDRAPSAELRANQTDQDSLPPYELLDEVLHYYIEHQCSMAEIVRRGMDADLVYKVITMVDRNEFKRRQAAMGLKISQRAFGQGRRIPVAHSFIHRQKPVA